MLAILFNRIFIEGLKYLLIGHFLFGYEFTKRNRRFAILLYLLLIPPAEHFQWELFWILWGIWLFLCVFEIKVRDSIKSCLISFFLISFVDICIFVIMVGFYPGKVLLEDNWFDLFVDMIGVCFWLLFCKKGNQYQIKFQTFWNHISAPMYVLVICCIAIVTCLLGGLQAYFYQITDRRVERLTLAAGITMVFMLVFLVTKLMSAKEEKIKIQEKEKYLAKYVALQKIHIERLIRKSEEMRGFRHDIHRHFFIMQKYCENGDLEKVQSYLTTLLERQTKHTELYFGNVVIDCLINQVVEELREQGELLLSTDGRMPQELLIEDTDISILLGNALENAKEALEKVEMQKRFLGIEIRHYQNWLYFNIQNSVKDKDIVFETTSKKNAEIHGFGIYNMKRIAEKYSGTITWNVEKTQNMRDEVYVVIVKMKLFYNGNK